ncbi:MAG TPA: hypothetical protein VGD94_24685 [Vicinamibacterales bacterium]
MFITSSTPTPLGAVFLSNAIEGATTFDDLLRAVRPFAREQMIVSGIEAPDPGSIFDALGFDREIHPDDEHHWAAFCAVLTFAYMLGFRRGQILPAFGAEVQ